MKERTCLSTRTEQRCPQCGQEFELADPTDVLATRPIEVNLLCPDCHFPARATLTEDNSFRSVFPSPIAASPEGIANDNDGWLTASAFDPLPRFRRPNAHDEDKTHPHLRLVT